MITTPPNVYITAKAARITASSIWSYGTINLSSRFIKRLGKTVQGLNPVALMVTGPVYNGSEMYSFSSKTKHYIVVPRFDADGNAVTDKQARDAYTATGLHLGIFKSNAAATKYSAALEKSYKAWAVRSIETEFLRDKQLVDATFQYADNQSLSWYTGNIDLFSRPVVENADKTVSTLLSISVFLGGKHVLIPRVVLRANRPTIVSSEEAIKEYQATGQHLGKFGTSKEATIAAKRLSKQQDEYYKKFYKEPSEAALSRAWQPVETLLKSGKGTPPFAGIIRLPDIADATAQQYFYDNLLSVRVQYNMDLTSSVTLTIRDENFLMMDNNYFVPRRLVEYRGRNYEIADISCGPGQSGSPEVSISICSRAVQQMKRDKKRGSVKGNSGFDYARNAAIKYNLGFVGQKTAKTKSQFNAKSGDQEESVWNVLNRTAGSNQYVCFEVDGILFYAQHEYLMWRFGLIEALVRSGGKSLIRKYTPLLHLPGNDGPVSQFELEKAGIAEQTGIKYSRHLVDRFGFRLETWPQFETSDNDPLAATGSCRVQMPNGGQLRPGHTVIVGPKPDYFFGAYLVTSVSFTEGSPESAQVSFRTPLEPLTQKGKPITSLAATSPVSLGQRSIGIL